MLTFNKYKDEIIARTSGTAVHLTTVFLTVLKEILLAPPGVSFVVFSFTLFWGKLQCFCSLNNTLNFHVLRLPFREMFKALAAAGF